MGRLFTILMIITVSAEARVQGNDPMKCILAKPMVAGSSVSFGLDGISFADHLVNKYGRQKNMIHEAYPGAAGETVISYPSFSRGIKSASVVLALDFFYWDQFSCQGPDGEKRVSDTIHALFKRSVNNGVPLVLGNITEGIAPFTRTRYEHACAETINHSLKVACDQFPKKCLFVDHRELIKFVNETFAPKLAGLSEVERARYIKMHITRDGVHPRTDAYAVIAEYLDQMIRASNLECK